MAEELKPVNLPGYQPTEYFPAGGIGDTLKPTASYDEIFNNLLNQSAPKDASAMPTVASGDIDMSGRYPKFFTGLDNEELYAQNQSFADKAFNGVTKMAGIATSTFINGTVGIVNGINETRKTGKFNSFYNNDLSNSLNDFQESLNDKYAFYKTERERNGNWWEPSNLLTANFLFDNIVSNMGFALGAGAAGLVTGGLLGTALKGIAKAARLTSLGVESAAAAEGIVSEAAGLSNAEALSAVNSRLNSVWTAAKSKIGAGLLKSDRAITALTATAGEAGLEALNNSIQFRTQMIQDYKKNYGVDPEGADLERINQYSESVGNFSFAANTALLSVTNYIQLPKIFSSSFKSEKGILNGVAREAGDVVSTLPQKGFGKLMYGGYKAASALFSPAEAFEEGAQFAIQTGTQNYFARKTRGEKSTIADDAIGYGIKEALTSDEGLLNIFTGGVSGGLMTMGLVGKKDGKIAFGQTGTLGERGLFGYGGEQSRLRDEAIPALQKTRLKQNLIAANNNINTAESIQEDRKDAILANDKLESKDLEFDYAHTFISTRLKYGAEEMVYEEIDEMRQEALTDFTKLQKEGVTGQADDQQSFLARLDLVEAQTKHASQLQKALDLKYSGLANKEGKRLYSDNTIDKLVYAAAKVNDYNHRIPQLSVELGKYNISLENILGRVVRGEDVTLEEVNKEIADQLAEYQKTTQLTDTEIADATQEGIDYFELGLRRRQFIGEYNEILKNPENFVTPEEEDLEKTTEEKAAEKKAAEEAVKGPTVKIKTQRGDTEVEIGKEYFVGNKSQTDKGNAFYEFTKFTVLAVNENGDIKVQFPDGKMGIVAKDGFANYKIGNVELVKNNKKALFFIENANNVYSFNFGKTKGGKVQGRLEYDDGKLEFVFKNAKGKIDRIELHGKHFVAKKGFKQAIVEKVGTLTKGEQKVLDDFTNDKTPDPSVLEKVATVAGTIEVIFDETLETLEDTKELIQQKTEELGKIEQQLEELGKKVEGPNAITNKTKRFKATTHRTLQAIKQLIKMRDQLRKELSNLQSEQEGLEIRLEDLIVTAEELQDQPGNYRELYDSMRKQREGLNDAILETGLQINKLSNLIDMVENVIESAYKAAKSLIEKFFDKYPGVPLDRDGIIAFLNKNLEDTKTEKAITPTSEAEKILPYTAIAAALYDDINQLDADLAQIDEADVTPNEPIAKQLRDELRALQEELSNYEKQLSAKEGTLKRLRELYKLHKTEADKARAVQLEKELKINEVKEQFLGTIDNSIPTTNHDSNYEPDNKKSLLDIIRATIATTKLFLKPGETLREHHVRANKFGTHFESFRNKDNIYGVLVSKGNGEDRKGNEEELGMTGLIDHIGGNDRTVVLVMVEEQSDGSLLPVDENGKAIVSSEDRINKGIYQVRPDPKLRWSSGETMFREEDKPIEEEVRKVYAKEIDYILNNPSLNKYKITPSFGNADYVTHPDQINPKTNKPIRNRQAKTTLKAAGLIKDDEKNDDLREKKLIYIPTTNDRVEKGSTSYTDALGRVFLDLGNAYVKLKNAQYTDAKATAIYDAVLRLASIGKIKGSTEANDLVSWLRTVVYWGTPKEKLSYNSLFFEDTDDGLKLFISGKGSNIPFTPTSIKANKETIIELLKEMYHNVNSRQATSDSEYNKPYTEIISVSEAGKMVTRQWPNYQSYLMSDKNPDGSTRKIDEIPLTTEIRPLENAEDSNREGIYFIMDDLNIDEYSKAINKKQPKKILGKKAAKETVTTAQAKAASTAVASEFTLDGETDNTVSMFKGEVEVKFKVNQDEFYNEDGTVNIESVEVVKGQKFLNDKYKSDADKILGAVRGFIASKVKPQVDDYLSGPIEEQTAPAPAPTEFVLDGKTSNPLTMYKGTVAITFKVNANEFYDENGNAVIEEVVIVSGYDELQKHFPEADKDDLIARVRGFVATKVKPFVDESLENKEDIPQEPIVSSATPDEVSIETTDEMDDIDPNKLPTKEYRMAVLNANEEKLERENWDEIESWLNTAFPNIPVYRVKRMIQAANGRQAWGMYKDGAIYVYENALAGTAYHEVFEAIWDTLVTPKEKSRIYKEVKAREGSFFDRETAKQVKYSTATNHQIKEALAEELIDYIRKGQKPVGPAKSFLEKIFDDIINFFKEMFFGEKGKNNTEKLFEKIGNGYYAQYNPYQSKLSFAKAGFIDIDNAIANGNEEYRYALMGFTDVQWDDLMQQMTYFTVSNLLWDPNNPDKSIFDINVRKKADLYDDLKSNVLEELKMARAILKKEKSTPATEASIKNYESLYQNIKNNWDAIIESHTDYLIPYEIDFDENDNAILRDENNSGKEDYKDANKIDTFRKANTAIKLFLATLPVVDAEGITVMSTVNGPRLQQLSKVKNDIQNAVDKSRTPDEMIGNIRKLAEQNVSYKLLFERVTFGIKNFSLDKMSNVGQSSLITGLWKTFAKTNPEVKYVYILSNGDVVIDDSNFSTATDQSMLDLEADLTVALRDPSNKLFTYDAKKKGGGYFANADALGPKPDTIAGMITFLKRLGIEFDIKEIEKRPQYKTQFMEAVGGMHDSLKEAKKVATISGKSLELRGRLREIAQIEAMIKNPEFDSTHYNINGELTQTFIGRNAHSDLFDMLSQVKNLNDLQGTRYEYLMNNADNFSQNSVKMAEMFNRKTGNITVGRNPMLMKNGYFDGIFNSAKGKRVSASKMDYRDRLVAQINLALKGYYFNLVPGDAGMEHMSNMGNSIDLSKSIAAQLEMARPIFKGYFIDEINVSREERKIVIPEGSERKNTDLRFLKSILDNYEKGLHDKIVAEGNRQLSPTELYDKYADKIDAAIADYFEFRAATLLETMEDYNLVEQESENVFNVENIAFGEDLSKDELQSKLHSLSLNFAINNIEMHKLVYSDPYFYKDELKRVKNFNSPHQALAAGSANLNTAFDKVWNKLYKTDKKETGGYNNIGYTNFFNDSLVSATLEDVKAVADIKGPWGTYGSWDEGDGGGMIMFQGLRKLRIAAGEWDSNEERQYVYDIAWEKVDKDLYDQLSVEEIEAYDKGNPKVQSAYKPYKPVVNGNKDDGKKYNDIVLDKFALFPISYRIMKEFNKEANVNYVNLHNRMQASGVDYVVFGSGRKVGSNTKHKLYDKDGNFVTDSFGTVEDGGISIIPLTILSNQTDVPTKETSTVTTGSQAVKLMTLDLMEGGVPVDFMRDSDFSAKYQEWVDLSEDEKLEASKLYKEIKNNQKIIEALIKNGMEDTMNILGITKEDGKYVIKPENRTKAYDTLRNEMLRREVNSNVIASLAGFLNGETILEATPAYRQIKNILYSIADKNIVSRTITGSKKVQMPSTLLETLRPKEVTINGKTGYTSEYLKFYNEPGPDGNPVRVCEIAVRRWFKSDKTDDELMDYFNNTEEGRAQLSAITGIGFRIPSQKQNSIDVFRIAKFLPEEMGDVVIIPSALVRKVGSDFDIDALSMYFKNLRRGKNGYPEVIPFYGFGEEAKEKIAELYDSLNESEMALYDDVFNEAYKESFVEGDLAIKMAKATAAAPTRESRINSMYRKSLQNAYIQSSENLVSSEENYEQLIKPNSADVLIKLTNELLADRGKVKPDYSKVDTMLVLEDMARIRYNLVTGKRLIGIAAQAQTNHSLNQRLLFTVDPSRRDRIPVEDRKWIGDAEIKFKKFNSVFVNGEKRSTLSMIKDANNDLYISDVNGMIIDGSVDISKDDWLMQMGATPQTIATYLFLIKEGVPVKDVVYFMNQPIIRDYLTKLESKGYSYLFIEDYVEELEDSTNYGKKSSAVVNSIPSFDKLQEMIRKDKDKLTNDEAVMQRFMLREFLKYAKMAQQLFYVSQGTNFDTANLNDPFLIFKKMMQLSRAKNTIFSNVEEFLEQSFLGVLGDTMEDVRNAIAALLPSDQGSARLVLEKTLLPYIDLPDNQFVRIAQTAVADLFDWAVQNDEGQLNTKIEKILINKKGTASQVMTFIKSIKKGHPLYQNVVIDAMGEKPAEKEKQANNLYIKNKANKVYDENRYIYGFAQIKQYLESQGKGQLYDDLVSLSILQSGLRTSPISFTSLLPYEDFKNKYAETLSYINEFSNLDEFTNLDVFKRNNWNNSDIVPSMSASYIKGMYNPSMNHFLPKKAKSAIQDGKVPMLLQVSINSIDAKDVVSYSWEKGSTAEKKRMRKEKDYSYIKKGLFKKVYEDETQTIPLIRTYINPKNGKPYLSYVYKMVNAWGQGIYANELYMEAKPSVFDNGYIKVEERTMTVNRRFPNGEIDPQSFIDIKFSPEVNDSEIVKLYPDDATIDISPVTEQSVAAVLPIEQNFIDGQGSRKMQSKFAGKSTMDLILSGDRTRTTRAKTDIARMIKDYGLTKIEDLVGKIIPMTDKSGRIAQTRITKVVPFTQKYQDATWQKEGWEKSVTDKLIGQYPYAIEFELVQSIQTVGSGVIDFKEEPTSGYRERTIKNASADATIALAVDFNSAGEKLTKNSVLNQGKKYVARNLDEMFAAVEPFDLSKGYGLNDNAIFSMAEGIVRDLNSVNAKTLNIAGNGIYTMKNKYSQNLLDEAVERLLEYVIYSDNLENQIVSIRTGGQTGIDEAGAKAGIKLQLPTTVLAPKGWTFRNIAGQDISNEQQFKSRFPQPSTEQTDNWQEEDNTCTNPIG